MESQPVGGFVGVVHVPAMPGDPRYKNHDLHQSLQNGFMAAYAKALHDAEILVRGGVNGIIIENFGSAPFAKGMEGSRVPPHHVALLTRIASTCVERYAPHGITIGINCLRNDVISALGIAAACGLGSSERPGFVRVNVHTGAYVTDQGLIEGEAATSLRYRQSIHADHIAILADVHVKHAKPLAPMDATTATHDCLDRGLADGVIVTGAATGAPVSPALLEEVRMAAGKRPVWIGSGLSPENAPRLAPLADGAIVGTWLKHDGLVHNPVDVERVRAMALALRTTLRQKEW